MLVPETTACLDLSLEAHSCYQKSLISKPTPAAMSDKSAVGDPPPPPPIQTRTQLTFSHSHCFPSYAAAARHQEELSLLQRQEDQSQLLKLTLDTGPC